VFAAPEAAAPELAAPVVEAAAARGPAAQAGLAAVVLGLGRLLFVFVVGSLGANQHGKQGKTARNS